MQKVESVIDEPNSVLAFARRLSPRKARQSIVSDAAKFAIEIGAFRPTIREDDNDAGIFIAPIEAGRVSNCARPPTIRTDIRKPSSLISWSHCGPEGAISTGWQSWGGIQRGSGDAI
jgi:hypothetical protein